MPIDKSTTTKHPHGPIKSSKGEFGMKSLRQEKILELIAQRDIDTQHSLANALRAEGLESTQATISRDIRELGLTKELGPSGGYRYVAHRQHVTSSHSARLLTIFKESVTHIAVAQNLVILKTIPGLAPAAGSAVDSAEYPGLVGTLAGDDTVFLAMEDANAAKQLRIELTAIL